MNELYWITRLDGINTVLGIFIAMAFISAIVFMIMSIESFTEKDKISHIKKSIICGGVGIFTMIVMVFVPTTQQALIIYGVGGTIDYVKSNETAKKLPDKAIIALDKYLESLNKEENKTNTNK